MGSTKRYWNYGDNEDKEFLDVVDTDKPDVDRTPGIYGIARTKAGNYMVYQVGETGKLHHTSVHANRREANGRLLERLMA